MSELEQALQKFPNVKGINGQYQVRCPCHDDKHASLSLSETPDGRLLAYCHAGCSFENIIKALDLQPDRTNDTPVITATYDYKDALTGESYQVVRYNPKAFKQRRPDGKGGWLWNLNGITPNLYMRDFLEIHIQEHPEIPVWIVEGEKDVLSLMKVGQVATSISGGASTKWHPSLVPVFEGARVVIIPDNDETGRKYSQNVANLLYGWCSSLKVINLPSLIGNILPIKDASDYLETQTIDNLLNILYNTREYIPSGAVTSDEFDSFKGVNRYLWKLIRSSSGKKKPQPKKTLGIEE